eukprot:15483819-Alexandrium_andersonii.AAC.1
MAPSPPDEALQGGQLPERTTLATEPSALRPSQEGPLWTQPPCDAVTRGVSTQVVSPWLVARDSRHLAKSL